MANRIPQRWHHLMVPPNDDENAHFPYRFFFFNFFLKASGIREDT